MKILLADDHDLVRDTLIAFFEREGSFETTATEDLPGAMKAIREHGPFDLVLLDYNMPGMNGLDGLDATIQAAGDTPVAIISGSADAEIAGKAIQKGAVGFIPKTLAARSLVSATRLMAAGEKFVPIDFLNASTANEHPLAKKLSDREKEVLDGLCRGLANKEIAREIDLQEVTVKLHVKTLCRKLEARNRTHAAMIAKNAGLT